MLRRTGVLLVALVAASGCSLGPVVTGSGTIIESTPGVAPFDSIQVGAAFEVNVRIADRHDVVLRTDDNVLDLVEITVSDGQLRLGTEAGVRDATLEADVTVPADGLNDIALDGAASLTGIEPLETDTLSLRAAGASRAFLVVDVATLDLGVDGASVVNVSGRSETVSVDARGASTARLTRLVAEEADVDADGASRVGLTVTGALTARADGASTVRYSGDPATVERETSGASSVQPEPESSR